MCKDQNRDRKPNIIYQLKWSKLPSLICQKPGFRWFNCALWWFDQVICRNIYVDTKWFIFTYVKQEQVLLWSFLHFKKVKYHVLRYNDTLFGNYNFFLLHVHMSIRKIMVFCRAIQSIISGFTFCRL